MICQRDIEKCYLHDTSHGFRFCFPESRWCISKTGGVQARFPVAHCISKFVAQKDSQANQFFRLFCRQITLHKIHFCSIKPGDIKFCCQYLHGLPSQKLCANQVKLEEQTFLRLLLFSRCQSFRWVAFPLTMILNNQLFTRWQIVCFHVRENLLVYNSLKHFSRHREYRNLSPVVLQFGTFYFGGDSVHYRCRRPSGKTL